MIYFVSNQITAFTEFKQITVEESLTLIKSWGNLLQYDSETDGLDCHINKLLCIQIGSCKSDEQVVIDAQTVDIRQYKEVLEGNMLIGHNIKFDLEFLYNYEIRPLLVYDTMTVEQFLHLGWPSSLHLYGLASVADRRLGIYIDKSIRGSIIWKGLTEDVIQYAANDVKYLRQIMLSQLYDVRQIPNAMIGIQIECSFVPIVAYMEWCGIKLDEDKWKIKMAKDKEHLQESIEALKQFVINHPVLNKKFITVNRQGDLFTGYNLEPVCTINWSSSPQVIKIAKLLGFNTNMIDKKTGDEKDSAMEKQLISQVGINDEFLKLYYGQGEEDDDDYFPGYSGSAKVVSSFGQGHLNAINPNTGRIHTIYRAIGTISGRMSCGSKESNKDLARLKHLPEKEVSYPNMQQLPKTAETRACFIAEKGNLFCSCDYAAMEARIGADVYNETKLLDEFLYGSGDTHAAYAKAVYTEELKDIDTKDIKKKRPDLRNKVKSIEFAVQFGSDGTAVAPQLKISVEQARQLVQNLLNGMTGLKRFKEVKSKFVLSHGYVEILPATGHRAYWYNWEEWKKFQSSMDWEDYRVNHKGTGDEIAKAVKKHFKDKSEWCDRKSLNLPTQGGGAVVLKVACINWYKWVIDNGYWGKILLCNLTHDEMNTEFPKELKDTYPQIVAKIMKDAAAQFYHKLPIPAEASVGMHWIH